MGRTQQSPHRLPEINDVNHAPAPVNVGTHLWVPAADAAPKVHTSIDQGFDGDGFNQGTWRSRVDPRVEVSEGWQELPGKMGGRCYRRGNPGQDAPPQLAAGSRRLAVGGYARARDATTSNNSRSGAALSPKGARRVFASSARRSTVPRAHARSKGVRRNDFPCRGASPCRASATISSRRGCRRSSGRRTQDSWRSGRGRGPRRAALPRPARRRAPRTRRGCRSSAAERARKRGGAGARRRGAVRSSCWPPIIPWAPTVFAAADTSSAIVFAATPGESVTNFSKANTNNASAARIAVASSYRRWSGGLPRRS